MTIQLRGDNIIITMTSAEYDKIKGAVPYALWNGVEAAKADPNGIVDKEVTIEQPKQGANVKAHYKFKNPHIDNSVRAHFALDLGEVEVTGPQIVIPDLEPESPPLPTHANKTITFNRYNPLPVPAMPIKP